MNKKMTSLLNNSDQNLNFNDININDNLLQEITKKKSLVQYNN